MNAHHRYINGLYECMVDRGLHLEAIRVELASRGIPRSRAQVRHDLDTVYCFSGYSELYPAPVELSLKEFDAAIDRR